MKGVALARELPGLRADEASPEGWGLDALAGRLVELSGGDGPAALSVCAGLILEAQRRGELAAWIGRRETAFYPPDLAAAGVDLDALPVVLTQDASQALRAADALLRSGGFAVIALDLGAKARLPLPVQTRLLGLATRHATAVMVLGPPGRPEAPRTSLASLRATPSHGRVGHDRFVCEVCAVKDKRRPPGWTHSEVRRGPDGLC